MNYQKSLHRDDHQWVVTSSSDIPDGGGENSFENFKSRVRVDVCKTKSFLYNLQQYRSVKFNYFSYYITCVGVAYQPMVISEMGPKQAKLSTNFGINSVVGKMPFYVLWNSNCDIPAKLLPGDLMDSMHTRKIFVGGKGVKFFYKVHKDARRYIDCTYVKSIDPYEAGKNNLYQYMLRLGLSGTAPAFFYGTGGDQLSKIREKLTTPEMKDTPLSFIFNISCKMGCTFKGKNDLVYSYTSAVGLSDVRTKDHWANDDGAES